MGDHHRQVGSEGPPVGTVVVSRGDGVVVASWCLPPGRPVDLALVGHLCRLQLLAHRWGWSVVLHDLSVDLRDVLDLVGVADVVGAMAATVDGSGHVVGEPEVPEQLGVQEVVEPDDPSP